MMKGVVLQSELRNSKHTCYKCHSPCRFVEEVYDIPVYFPSVKHYGLFECVVCHDLQMGECLMLER